jgi:hypothetical protein
LARLANRSKRGSSTDAAITVTTGCVLSHWMLGMHRKQYFTGTRCRSIAFRTQKPGSQASGHPGRPTSARAPRHCPGPRCAHPVGRHLVRRRRVDQQGERVRQIWHQNGTKCAGVEVLARRLLLTRSRHIPECGGRQSRPQHLRSALAQPVSVMPLIVEDGGEKP